MRRTTTSATVSAFVALAVAGCSANQTVYDTFNAADVRYAKDVIATHQRAIDLADIARTRSKDPAVLTVVEATDTEARPKITRVAGLFRSWGEKEPEPFNPSSHRAEPGIPAISGRNEAQALSRLDGATFDDAFLRISVAHSREDLAHAERQVTRGKDRIMVELARSTADERPDQIRAIETRTGRRPPDLPHIPDQP